MKYKLLVLPILLLVASCASKPEPGSPEAAARSAEVENDRREKAVGNTVDEMPEWYLEPNCRLDLVLCSTSTATSGDLQMAVDKAIIDAKATTADKLSGLMNGKVSRYIEELGSQGDQSLYDEASRVISGLFVDVNLAGYRITQKSVQQEGSRYRAYVLLEFPIGEANMRLVEEIKKNERLESRLRATEAYKDLELEVQRYRESR